MVGIPGPVEILRFRGGIDARMAEGDEGGGCSAAGSSLDSNRCNFRDMTWWIRGNPSSLWTAITYYRQLAKFGKGFVHRWRHGCRGTGKVFCDDSITAFVLNSVSRGRRVKNSPKMRDVIYGQPWAWNYTPDGLRCTWSFYSQFCVLAAPAGLTNHILF